MKCLKVLFLLSALVTVALPAGAATIYVATPANGGSDTTGNGSEALPYATIQYAFNHAADNDTIMVGEGTYVECLFLSGVLNGSPFEQLSVHLVASAFDAGDPSTRLLTVLDGSPCGAGYSTVNVGGFDSSIEGFKIIGGTTGGVWNIGGATITNNVIEGNISSAGGGIYSYPDNCFYGIVNVAITNNLIRGNVVSYEGSSLGGLGGGILAGLYPEEYYPGDPLSTPDGCLGGGGTVLIEDNTLELNYSEYDGGAIYAFTNGIGSATTDTSAQIIITQNLITDNQAGLGTTTEPTTYGYGGGIFATAVGVGEEDVQVIDNQVLGNVATAYGGGIWAGSYTYSVADHSVTIDGNTITQNSAGTGGGIEVSLRTFELGFDQNASLVTSNNVISGNTARNPDELGGGGGLSVGMFVQRSSAAGIELKIENNTIRSNIADADGGGAELRVASFAQNVFNPLDTVLKKATATVDFTNNKIVLNETENTYSDAVGGGVFVFVQAEGGESALPEESSTSAVNFALNTLADNTTQVGSGGIEVESLTRFDANFTGEGITNIDISSSIIESNTGFGVGGPQPGQAGLFTPGFPGGDTANFTLGVEYCDVFANDVNFESWVENQASLVGNISADAALNPTTYEPELCSVTVDAGDPVLDYSLEPQFNGNRVNQGHTGGTADATLSLPDVDGDGLVDGIDVLRIATTFASQFGENRYSADADLNGDGMVDGNDLSLVGAQFGSSCQ